MHHYDKRPMIMAEEIMNYFDSEIGGVASDLAFYELTNYAYSYLKGDLTKSGLLDYLSFNFGLDEETFDVCVNHYRKRISQLDSLDIL